MIQQEREARVDERLTNHPVYIPGFKRSHINFDFILYDCGDELDLNHLLIPQKEKQRKRVE